MSDGKLKEAVSQTIKYADGSETTIHYNSVGKVVPEVAPTEESEFDKLMSEVTATESAPEIGEASGTAESNPA